MYNTKNDLPEATRTKAITLLNARLADAIDLQTQMKQAHWNVKGPSFIALHELFDKVNEDVESYVDDIAERAVTLGGTVLGTARSVAKASQMTEYPLQASTGRDHVDAVSSALAQFGKSVRAAIDRATSYATRTPRICSPESRAASTSGCGSSSRTCKQIARGDGSRCTRRSRDTRRPAPARTASAP